VRGYFVQLKGLNIDAVLEKFNKHNIVVFELKRNNHMQVEFKIDNKSFNQTKKFFDQYETQIVPLGTNKTKKILASNLAVFLAVFLLLGIFSISSNYIWNINVSGVSKSNLSAFEKVLNENGIKRFGKKVFNAQKLEQILLSQNFVAQASCFYKGTTLFINISEKLVYNQTNFEPLKAKFSGVILQATNIVGTPNFVVGEYVSKGDVLVFPYLVDKFNQKVSVEPKAEIKAKCYIYETNIVPRKEIVLTRTGKLKKFCDISFNKKNIAKNRKPFVFFETKVYNNYVSSILPIVRQKTIYYELQPDEKINDLENLTTQNEKLVEEKLKNIVPTNIEILERNTTSLIVEDKLYSTAYVCCVTDII